MRMCPISGWCNPCSGRPPTIKSSSYPRAHSQIERRVQPSRGTPGEFAECGGVHIGVKGNLDAEGLLEVGRPHPCSANRAWELT